jgi:hypothetical protein
MLFLLFFQPKFLFPSFCLPPVHGSPRVQECDSSASQARHEYGNDEHRELEEPVFYFSGLVLCFNGEGNASIEVVSSVLDMQRGEEHGGSGGVQACLANAALVHAVAEVARHRVTPISTNPITLKVPKIDHQTGP